LLIVHAMTFEQYIWSLLEQSGGSNSYLVVEEKESKEKCVDISSE